MTELLTAAQMRSIEQAAIESGDVTGLELMERAGRGVIEAVFEEWPEFAKTSHRAVVLCGPGNNGGDGFVVARLLKEWGWEVEVFLYGDADKLPPDARVNYERWLQLGDILPLVDEKFERFAYDTSNVSLIVDAIFGTGLSRPFLDCPNVAMLLNVATEFAISHGEEPKVVTVDVPSGLCADSGKWLGIPEPLDDACVANLAVTFHSAKVGHELGNAPLGCGKVIVKRIGLENIGNPSVRDSLIAFHDLPLGGRGLGSYIVTKNPIRFSESKTTSSHKFNHGHALILTGGPGKTGASRLAARGALRIGAGLVTLGVPPSAQMEVASQITAIMLKRIEDADGLAATMNDKRLNALCIGPGFGKGERERALIGAALETKRPIVLDADALSARFFDEADALFGKLHDTCVLTPHAGEFARMFPDIAEKLNAPATKGPAYSKVDATREAAKRAGCVVLFKGADTVIAAPNGRCSINSAHYERAAPWLATAGSGDVLAGFVTGLLARGFTPMQAAETGAWLHVECALKFGPGLIAEDIPEQLPAVFRDLSI